MEAYCVIAAPACVDGNRAVCYRPAASFVEEHMAQIGVNAWVWTSPVNTAEFGRLAPMVNRMGFDLIEFGIEGTSDLDYGEAAKIARGHRPGARGGAGVGAAA